MNAAIRKLADLAGPALSPADPKIDLELAALAGPLAASLIELLRIKNGFYAFESALHVFPTQSSGTEIGLAEWNSPALWIDEYQDMANGCLFFAEDIFGCQFCIKAASIFQFDPETGRLDKVAGDLESWAAAILRDYPMLTGHPLAHEWQQANGGIAPGVRLVPKIPFCRWWRVLFAESLCSGCGKRDAAARLYREADQASSGRCNYSIEGG